jgi:putative hydrolase of the HAD superfamily
MMLKKLEIILAAEEIRIMTKDLEEIVLKDPPPLISDTELVLNSLFETYKIGLICDSGMSPGKVMREILAAYDLLQYFDSMVFSDELGVTKPDSRAYQTALDQMGVDAQKAMHVGDLLATDVAGARSVGMKSVWLNREGVRRVNRTVAPDYEIHRLAELLDIVRKETSV